ncbi:MAG: hypothetical protein AAF566_01215 [Pseudomonadota bacterium]
MAALTLLEIREPSDPYAKVQHGIGEAGLGILNHLRMVALECRAAARADLFEACALISTHPSLAKTAYAEALIKCLPQAIGKTPRMLRPGETEVTFDEAWIAQLVTASATKDFDSFDFLLRSRVEPWARRNVAFLVTSFSEQFSQI